MSENARRGMLLVLCLVLVVGMVFAGCGKGEEALQQPGLVLTSYVKGSTVDFDDSTVNSMAQSGGEFAFKYGIAKNMYPTVWATCRDIVAQDPNVIATQPYWRGDGIHTYYSNLTNADQTAVDGYIYSCRLSAEEQAMVVSVVEGFFGLYDDEVAAAKALNQNTAYGTLALKVTAEAAAAWEADATAWMAALNGYARANYGGRTYAQLTYVERNTVEGMVFANGSGAINPEYAFWRGMAQTGFRNGNASARWPDKRDAMVAAMYQGKTYAQLDCTERPSVDGAVWLSCNDTEREAVDTRIAGTFILATEQVNGVASDNVNACVYALSEIPDPYLVSGNATVAIGAWLAGVNGTIPGTSENGTFYAQIQGGQMTWRNILANRYFGAALFDNLTDVQKGVVVQADEGMFYLSVAQRSDTMPLTSNVIYQTLAGTVSTTAADSWAAEVGAGMDRELAMYKWMACEGFRNGIAVKYYPTQLAAEVSRGKTYAALATCEQLGVNAALWVALGAGEQLYVTSVVSGMWDKVQAEMTDVVAVDQTSASMQLRSVMGNETAAANFEADVQSGVLVRQAFYRWLAKEKVKEMQGSALMIQQSVGEFYVRVTNPNKYVICIDRLSLKFRTTAGSSNEAVDAARQVLEDIYVPAEGEITVKVLAVTRVHDILSWLVVVGKDSDTARSMATEVFNKMQNGTIAWTYTADMQVSHGNEILSPTYSV